MRIMLRYATWSLNAMVEIVELMIATAVEAPLATAVAMADNNNTSYVSSSVILLHS